MIRNSFALAAVLACFTHAHAEPVVVSTCGQVVQEGVLVGNLDCSAGTGAAIVLSGGGTLDLAGYELQSGTGDSAVGVFCQGNCSIAGGGGTIVSATGAYDGTPQFGVSGKKVSISETTIIGYGAGVYGKLARVEASSLTENFTGINARRVLVSDSEINTTLDGAGEPITTNRADIIDSTIDGGGSVRAHKAKLYGSQITGMRSHGVIGNVRAENSTIDGNCLAFGYDDCADIVSHGRPKLVNTTCAHSARFSGDVPFFGTWSVCALD
jgi:hypothetical protein